MINLIPPEGHKVLKQEYMLRVGTTLAFLTGFVFLVFTAAQIPTYVLTSAQIKNFNAEAANDTDKVERVKNAESEVQKTREVITQLNTAGVNTYTSMIVGEIERSAPEGISFNTFSVGDETKDVLTVQVQGIAINRGALVSFKDALETLPLVEKAEIPIAELARESNLPFTITLTLNSKHDQ